MGAGGRSFSGFYIIALMPLNLFHSYEELAETDSDARRTNNLDFKWRVSRKKENVRVVG